MPANYELKTLKGVPLLETNEKLINTGASCLEKTGVSGQIRFLRSFRKVWLLHVMRACKDQTLSLCDTYAQTDELITKIQSVVVLGAVCTDFFSPIMHLMVVVVHLSYRQTVA